MPFIGVRDDRPILPLEVRDDGVVLCPRCDAEMRVREGEGIARHFYHVPVDSGCVGESNAHLEMKHIAAEKLLERYPAADVSFEYSVEGGERRADILVVFAEPDERLGKGIAVEVQYHHGGKSVQDVTVDYLRGGYSVMWLSTADYDGTHPGYEDVSLTDPVPAWPYAVPQPVAESRHVGDGADRSVQVSERELASFLDDDQIGQQPLRAFEDDSDATRSDSQMPSWSLERRVSLSLAPESKAAGRLLTEIFRHVLIEWERDSTRREKAIEYQNAAKASQRNCYLGERFTGRDRDSFTFQIIVTPSGEPAELTLETIGTGKSLSVAVGPDLVETFTELVLTACKELALVPERARSESGTVEVWSNELAASPRLVTCAISRTLEDRVELSLNRHSPLDGPAETLTVQFLQSDIEELLELCVQLRVHIDTEA